VRIGVLRIQGAFAEHEAMLRTVGAEAVPVRLPEHFDDLSGLILPGGESTAMRKLIDRWGLRAPILELAQRGVPIFGTCAGLILLANHISDGDEAVLPLLDVTVKRNAFGRQLDSFEAQIDVPILGDRPVHGVFIRAPIVERVGDEVDVLARLEDGSVVAVRQRNVMATAFHPELSGDVRFHRLLTTMAGAYEEPAEGSGRRPHPTRRGRQGATP
jgi:5'-phosphate synthase pdxT subunit